MEIRIRNFRKHSDLSLKLEGLSLIKGPSGLGKTTVFQALSWCLYGKLRSVHPYSQPKSKTSVTVLTQHVVVCRTRNPCLLSVDFSGKRYVDDEAQSVIDSLFGTRSVWTACCYLEQGQHHHLIQKSNSDSMELLDSLAFSGEDPRKFITKVELEYKTLEAKFLLLQKEYKEREVQLAPHLPSFQFEDLRSEEQISKLKSILEAKKSRIPSLLAQELEQKKLQGVFSALKTQLNDVENTLSSLPDLSFDEKIDEKMSSEQDNRRSLLVDKEKASEYWRKFDEHSRLSAQITSLQNSLTFSQDRLDELRSVDLFALSTSIDRYQRNFNLADKLSIPYQKDKIDEEIASLTNRISEGRKLQTSMTIYQKEEANRQRILNELSKIILTDFPSVEESQKQLEESQSELSEIERRVDLLICPHCSQSVRYSNRQLLPADSSPVSPQDVQHCRSKIHQVQQQISLAQKQKELLWKKESLTQQLSQLSSTTPPENAPSNEELSGWQVRLSHLSSIEVVPPVDLTSSDILQIRKIFDLESRLPIVPEQTQKVEEINFQILSSEKKIAYLQGLKVQQINLQKQRQSLEEKKVQLQNQIDSITLLPISDELSLLQSEVTRLTDEILKGERSLQIYIHHQKLLSLHAEVNEIHQDLVALQKLKTNAIQAECSQLDSVIETCNFVLAQVCDKIFDSQMQAELRLFRQLKNGLNKHQVNLFLSHRGMEVDVEQLSGGEKQRLSIALTLALSQFSNSPVLLLDECLAYLDADLQKSCLDAAKRVSTKALTYIGHNLVEGYFDVVREF
ncbi:DNA double-strand break repair ATPase [Pithovirus sibericum]|uniref:DNA double-strand break repair ATPase n=1 Tax=Pithovirus sibericum TaxID=1450746 RepID=W5S641_9VIRU|nr:DNA double-strand break repair ATPase [Pithovirus sibericum]AHH01782.1 DNA double-strand break repair ATPase [Pithovirus sibericum]